MCCYTVQLNYTVRYGTESTVLYWTVLNWTALYWILLCCAVCTVVYTVLHEQYFVLHCTALYCITAHRNALRRTVLSCAATAAELCCTGAATVLLLNCAVLVLLQYCC